MLKKREIFEWVFICILLGVIYIGGWQAEVAGFLQRGILLTGILNPDHLPADETRAGSYDFSLVNLDGQKLQPETLKNKVIFLNVWATWCAPCVAEMPGIHQLYQSVSRDEIVFVMVSVDDNTDKLRQFIKRKGYSFPVYLREKPLPEEYYTRSIPTTFVISPQGKIVFQEEGMANYDTEDFRQFLATYLHTSDTSSWDQTTF